MEPLDCISYKGYRIEVVADDDSYNPFTEDEGAPTLVLHNQAERHFGWTTDAVWQDRLTTALEEIRSRGVVRNLYGPRGALAIVSRWMRVCWGIPVVLPVSAIEHSGVAVYLGSHDHPADPGGWDSGWIGWLFATREQLKDWGNRGTPAKLEKNLRTSFKEFAAWVQGDVVGYRIYDPDGIEVESMFGIYGSDAMVEPDGWAVKECHAVVDGHIGSTEPQLELVGVKG